MSKKMAKRRVRVPRLRAVASDRNGHATPAIGLLKIDLGCGDNPFVDPATGSAFIGVDIVKFPKTQIVHDLRTPWPWPDSSVDEARSSHFVEHLKPLERIFFFNELYRVMKPEAKALIIAPHWCSNRAYGDMTHEWPPVSEFFFQYLWREWRLGNPEKNMAPNAPHLDVKFNPAGFNCNFDGTVGGSLHPALQPKSQDVVQYALANFKEAFQDVIATLTCKK